jgi:transcriptional regulator with XRE-family HTH domain
MEEANEAKGARMRRIDASTYKHVAKQIKILRKQAGLTQVELAKKVGVHQTAISKWELGVDIPASNTMDALCAALDTTPSAILGTGTDKNPPIGRRIKVVGELAAGSFQETIELPEPFEVLVAGLPSKYDNIKLEGLRVKGDSMNQIYPDGSIVYVAPVRAVSGWPRSGQVVVVMHHKQGLTEGTLKEYVVNEYGKWLYPRSNHPDHQAPVNYTGEHIDEEYEITGVVVAALVFAD